MTKTKENHPESWTKVSLTTPTASGFLHFGMASGDWRLPPALPSARRRMLRQHAHEMAALARTRADVLDASVFTALVRPPGGGEAGEEIAYDVVLLIETSDVAAAQALASWAGFQQLVETATADARDSLLFVASSPKRIAPVDHDRGGVFLFNYFSAPSVEANLFAWQYTAGWFQQQTGLDNSTLMQPAEGRYTLVNHCRWDTLRDIMPSLIFKPSFRRFVLRIFDENGVAPRPLLYRLA